MTDKLNIYECDELIRSIEAKAEANDGELTDDDMQAIVLAQTSSVQQFGKLINYVRYLEGFATLAKAEMDRLQARKKTAENRIESIKRWLLPYLEQHGPVSIGTCRLSLRASKGVVLADGFSDPNYCETVTVLKPDKKKIKDSIESGIEVKGAVLELRHHVQIR